MFGIPFYWWIIWILAVWFGFGVRYFKPDEVASVFWLGKRNSDDSFFGQYMGPGGLHWIPAGLIQLYILNINTQRTLVPGKKESIVRHDDDPIAEGQVRVVRMIHPKMQTASYFEKDADGEYIKDKVVPFGNLLPEVRAVMLNDTLHDTRISEIIGFAEWNIGWDSDNSSSQRAESLYQFIENIGSSMEAAHDRIYETFKSSLQGLMGRLTFQHAVEVKSIIEDRVKEELEKVVGEARPSALPIDPDAVAEKPWGINISAVKIVEINAGKTISNALALEATAITSRNAKIILADGERQATISQTDGEVDKIKRTGDAKAAAFEALAKVMETEGGYRAAQLDVAKEVLGKSGTVVVPSDLGGIASLVAVASSMSKK